MDSLTVAAGRGKVFSFELIRGKIHALLEARTELSRACYSRVISSVNLETLDMRFSPGCQECEIQGDVGLEQLGGQTGAG